MSKCPAPVRARVRREACEAWEWASRKGPREWAELLGVLSAEEWVKERVRLLSDLEYWLATMFGLRFSGNLLYRAVHGKLIGELEARALYVEERPATAEINMWLQARDTFKTSVFVGDGLQGVLRDREETLGVGTYRQEESNRRCQMMATALTRAEAHLYFPDHVWFPSEKRPQGVRYKTAVMDLKGRRAVTAGTIQGLSKESSQRGLHFSRLLIDDLVGEETVSSERARDKCEETWDYMAAAITTNAVFDIPGTPYADDDTYSELLARGIVTSLWIVPAVMTEHWLENHWQMQSRLGFKKYEEGRLCFPNRLTHETLDQKRLMHGPRVFSSQFLLEPGKETRQLKDDWLQVFERGDEPQILTYWMTADPGVSEREGSSESALCLSGWSSDGQMWIMDFDAGLWPPDEFAYHACSMYGRWKEKGIRGFGMENISFQRYAHSLIPKVARDFDLDIRMDTLPGHHLGVFGRIDNLVAAASAGWVHVEKRLVELILPQWRAFPDPTGKRMDRLDAISYQYARHTKGPLRGKTWVRLPPKPAIVGAKLSKEWPKPKSERADSTDRGRKPWWSVK